MLERIEAFVCDDPEIKKEFTAVRWTPRRREYLLRLLSVAFGPLFSSDDVQFATVPRHVSILAEAVIRQCGRLSMPIVMRGINQHRLSFLNPAVEPDGTISSFHLLSSDPRRPEWTLTRGRIRKGSALGTEPDTVYLFAPTPEELGANSRALVTEVAHAFTITPDAVNRALAEMNYVITYDYALKLIAIRQRHLAQIPTILEGETGVGKTELLKFYCALTIAHNKEKLAVKLMESVRDTVGSVWLEEGEEAKSDSDWVQATPMGGQSFTPGSQVIERFEAHGIRKENAAAIRSALQSLAPSLFGDRGLPDILKQDIGAMFLDAQFCRKCPLERASEAFLSQSTYNFSILAAALNFFARGTTDGLKEICQGEHGQC